MSVLLAALALFFLLDALRLRARMRQIPVLGGYGDGFPNEAYRVITASGVDIDDATTRAAEHHARVHDLGVVDLIPGNAHTSSYLALLQLFEPAKYRQDRFARGRTSGHAILVSADVMERANVVPELHSDPVSMAKLAIRLKRFACTRTDIAIAPGLRALPHDPNARRAVIRELLGTDLLGEFDWLFLLVPVALTGLFGWGLRHELPWGLAAIAAYHAQVIVALAGSEVRPRDFWRFTLLRTPIELWTAIRLLFESRRSDVGQRAVEERRPIYQNLLSHGYDAFFEPRRTTCPQCGSSTLKRMFGMGDLYQHKPGRFYLERCRACSHVFQNPRVSLTGLDFYYRDFYDGLGEDQTETVFSNYGRTYGARADMVKAVTTPGKWLDVGCGHGHFCCAARDYLPSTEFHGLDMSESVEEAVRRQWVQKAHRGLFPQLAPHLREQYDIVSMHHYLEHVIDHEAEIAAARQALRLGGHLLIEVPDPASWMGRLLGRWWVLWLQPQHLHFVSAHHMEQSLRKHGFVPVTWHRGQAHMPIDLSWMVVALMQRLGPLTDQPWLPPSSSWHRLRRALVWQIGLPVLVLAGLLDRLLAPLAGPLGFNNLYRVLARLEPHPLPGSDAGVPSLSSPATTL